MALHNEVASTHSSISPEQQAMDVQFSLWKTFKQHFRGFLLTTIIDIILPLVLYFVLQKYIEPVYAFIAASGPALLMVVFKAIRRRAFDPTGFLIVVAFITSAIASIISHNPTIVLLEKTLVMCVFSIMFAISMIPFHLCHRRLQVRPVGYYLYQGWLPTGRADIGLPDSAFENEQDETIDQNANLTEPIPTKKSVKKDEVAEVYKWIYAHCPQFRRTCYLITTIASIGFMLSFLIQLTIVLIHLPINSIVIYGNVTFVVTMGICIILLGICVKIERKSTLAYIRQWRIDHLNVTQSKGRSSTSSPSVVASSSLDRV